MYGMNGRLIFSRSEDCDFAEQEIIKVLNKYEWSYEDPDVKWKFNGDFIVCDQHSIVEPTAVPRTVELVDLQTFVDEMAYYFDVCWMEISCVDLCNVYRIGFEILRICADGTGFHRIYLQCSDVSPYFYERTF